MSRQNFCYMSDPCVQGAHEAVSWVIDANRRRGHKNEEAIELAARALDLTPRRAWALRYLTQPVRVMRTQYRLMLHRKWAAMDAEAAIYRARAAEIERQAEAEQLADAQFSLPLGGSAQCLQLSLLSSRSGDGDAN